MRYSGKCAKIAPYSFTLRAVEEDTLMPPTVLPTIDSALTATSSGNGEDAAGTEM